MTKKMISWLAFMAVFLIFYSCRSEDFSQNEKLGEQKYKVFILNKQQIAGEKSLLKQLSEIKTKFQYKANPDGKNIQNQVLDGAIIGNDEVLLVEKNGVKTYTFPVSRTYLSDQSENLVVRENADHTFSGILIQYDLSKEQQQKFISGEITDIKSKIKIYDIDKLIIASRVQTDVVGCYVITWETGWCSAGVHQTGSDNSCTVGGAPAPMILSIQDTCNEPGGGDSGGTGDVGNGGWIGIGPGGGSVDLGGVYTTFPFVSLGYQYYETEDPFDSNYVHYINTANYFSSLGNTLNQLRVSNPDLFYYTYFYFKDNGISNITKAFITERLTGLNIWYEQVNNNPNLSQMNNQYFLNWAFKYLVADEPDKSWEDFYNEYLATPCEKTKSMLNRPAAQQIISDVKTQALSTLSNVNAGEIGFKEKKDGTIAPADINASHKVVYNDVTDAYGGYHNHTANGTHMFSPPDIANTLLGFAAAQNNVGDAYFGMIAAEWCTACPNNKKILHYVVQYTGTASDLGNGGSYNFTVAQVTQFENDYRKIVRNLKNTYINGNTYIQTSGDLNEKGLEKLFFETLKIMGMIGKVNLQRIEANGIINNVTLDSNNMSIGTPCP